MKDDYKEMEMEIIRFSSEDVIVTSCGGQLVDTVNPCEEDNYTPGI